MVLDAFHIKEVSVRSPEQLSGVCRHVKRYARIMFESRIVPPLAEENVHGILLAVENESKCILDV